jgi:hypothetical protein
MALWFACDTVDELLASWAACAQSDEDRQDFAYAMAVFEATQDAVPRPQHPPLVPDVAQRVLPASAFTPSRATILFLFTQLPSKRCKRIQEQNTGKFAPDDTERWMMDVAVDPRQIAGCKTVINSVAIATTKAGNHEQFWHWDIVLSLAVLHDLWVLFQNIGDAPYTVWIGDTALSIQPGEAYSMPATMVHRGSSGVHRARVVVLYSTHELTPGTVRYLKRRALDLALPIGDAPIPHYTIMA